MKIYIAKLYWRESWDEPFSLIEAEIGTSAKKVANAVCKAVNESDESPFNFKIRAWGEEGQDTYAVVSSKEILPFIIDDKFAFINVEERKL